MSNEELGLVIIIIHLTIYAIVSTIWAQSIIDKLKLDNDELTRRLSSKIEETPGPERKTPAAA